MQRAWAAVVTADDEISRNCVLHIVERIDVRENEIRVVARENLAAHREDTMKLPRFDGRVGSHSSGSHRLQTFIVDGRAVVERRVETTGVVEAFDEIEDGQLGL